MIVGGNNIAISYTDYGIPLAFARIYGPGPVFPIQLVLTEGSLVHHFFWRALVFDVGFALLAVATSAFSIYRWSASWQLRRQRAVCIAAVTLGIPMLIDLPVPIGLFYLLALVLVLPPFLIASALYATWSCATGLFGSKFASPACLLVVFSFIAATYWAWPHDPFVDPAMADVPFLLERRLSTDPQVRMLAIHALGRLTEKEENVVDALVGSIGDENDNIRTEAISIVSRMGPASARAVPALVDDLRDARRDFMAAFYLGQIGDRAVDAIPALRSELPAAEGYKKLNIAEALWSIERNTTLVVPALIELLGNDFGPIRRDAASLLGQIGAPAKAAVPKLTEMVRYVPPAQDPMSADSSNAHASRTETEPAAPKVRQMSEEEFYPQIRTAAASALRKIDAASVATPQSGAK
jgi:HEAT repeat protein